VLCGSVTNRWPGDMVDSGRYQYLGQPGFTRPRHTRLPRRWRQVSRGEMNCARSGWWQILIWISYRKRANKARLSTGCTGANSPVQHYLPPVSAIDLRQRQLNRFAQR